MKNPCHLCLSRHQIYYFRFPLPAYLHPEGIRSEIKLSLQTRSPEAALHLSRKLSYLGQEVLIDDRLGLSGMKYSDIRKAIQGYFEVERDRTIAKIDRTGTLEAGQIKALLNRKQLAKRALANQDYAVIGNDADIERVIDALGMGIQTGSEQFELVRTEYIKATGAMSDSLLRYNAKQASYTFSGEPEQAIDDASLIRSLRPIILPNHRRMPVLRTDAPRKSSRNGKKLADAVTAYIAEKERLKEWTAKSAQGFRSQFDVLLDYLGQDTPLDMPSEVAGDVKTMLMQLPKRIKTDPKLKDLSIQAIISLPANHPSKKDNLLDNASIRKYLSAFSSFYDWAVKRKDATENNFKDINVKVDKNKKKRDPFTDEQINTITTAVLKEDKDYYKWGALIGCYTGARLEEIAQMTIADLREKDGIKYFDINDLDDEGKPKKKLKNESSKRAVPVHSKLIELGFFDYFTSTKKAGHDRILYGLTYNKNTGYGRNLGRWFNERLLPQLDLKTKRTCFHSLRHTVITKLQQKDVDASLMKRVIGHSQTDVANQSYAEGQTMAQRKAAIELIDY